MDTSEDNTLDEYLKAADGIVVNPSDSELAENIISGEIALALDQLFQRVFFEL